MSRKNLITACVLFTVLTVFWGWTGWSTYSRVGEFTGRSIMAIVCAVLCAIVPIVYIREYRKGGKK